MCSDHRSNQTSLRLNIHIFDEVVTFHRHLFHILLESIKYVKKNAVFKNFLCTCLFAF